MRASGATLHWFDEIDGEAGASIAAATNSEEFQREHNELVAEAVYANPDLAGLAFWQFVDQRTSWRDCGKDGRKSLSMSNAGQFDCHRRPKAVVMALAEWFKNRVPANMRLVDFSSTCRTGKDSK